MHVYVLHWCKSCVPIHIFKVHTHNEKEHKKRRITVLIRNMRLTSIYEAGSFVVFDFFINPFIPMQYNNVYVCM